MVIEYLEGENLEARLSREKWLSAHEAATIGVHVALGLAKAHGAGIIHRDLKPANIFVTEREDGAIHAKLLDFGLSKFDPFSNCGIDLTVTAFGTTMGTPLYMSPEQCHGNVDVDGRADVWALSAVLYEALAGGPAIEGTGHPFSTLMRIVHEGVEPLALRAPWVPDKLTRVIDAGLVRNRDERIRDAPTLAANLVDAISDYDAGSSPQVARATDVSDLCFDDVEPS